MAWTEKYVSVAGGGAHDGTTEANAWTLAEAIAAVAAGQRVNVVAGTYANTTTALTFATAGTTTAPIWWRGYNTTIGDIDSNNALTKPAWTWTDARMNITGTYQIFSNLNISGAHEFAPQVRNVAADHVTFDRCRIENTFAATTASAMSMVDGCLLSRCYIKATSTATRVIDMEPGSIIAATDCSVLGCTVRGGGIGVGFGIAAGNGFLIVEDTVIASPGTHGIEVETGANCKAAIIKNVHIYNAGTDGIRFTSLPTGLAIIRNCVFSVIGGYGVKNTSGANTAKLITWNNTFHSITSGKYSGFGDAPNFSDTTDDSSSPFTNVGAGDFSLVTGSNAKAGGLLAFENESFTSYLDNGAVQREEPTSGGGPDRVRMIQNLGGTH